MSRKYSRVIVVGLKTPGSFFISPLSTGCGVETSTVPIAVPQITTHSDQASSTSIGPPAMAKPPRTETTTTTNPMIANTRGLPPTEDSGEWVIGSPGSGLHSGGGNGVRSPFRRGADSRLSSGRHRSEGPVFTIGGYLG